MPAERPKSAQLEREVKTAAGSPDVRSQRERQRQQLEGGKGQICATGERCRDNSLKLRFAQLEREVGIAAGSPDVRNWREK